MSNKIISFRDKTVTVLPKKKVASSIFSYLISFAVLGVIISVIVLAINKLFIFIPIPIVFYIVLWLCSTRFSWFVSQELSIKDKRLKIVHMATVNTLGGGKTTYLIGKVLSVKESVGDLILRVEDASVQEHPMKPKPCKKVRIYEYTDEAKEFIERFMEGM